MDSPIAPIVVAATTEPFVFNPEEWKIELLAVASVLIYLVCYTYGLQRNKSISNSWLSATKEFWSSQFSYCSSLMFDSPNHYLFYASGRDHHIEKMNVTVEVCGAF
jgi:hypothetical protein